MRNNIQVRKERLKISVKTKTKHTGDNFVAGVHWNTEIQIKLF